MVRVPRKYIRKERWLTWREQIVKKKRFLLARNKTVEEEGGGGKEKEVREAWCSGTWEGTMEILTSFGKKERVEDENIFST